MSLSLNQREYFRNAMREWRINHREQYLYRHRLEARKYRQTHKDKIRAYVNASRRRNKLASPKWLSFQQLQDIKAFYNNCPPGFQVDHIYPLKGINSCGLHVLWNLQYLSESENKIKSNKILVAGPIHAAT